MSRTDYSWLCHNLIIGRIKVAPEQCGQRGRKWVENYLSIHAQLGFRARIQMQLTYLRAILQTKRDTTYAYVAKNFAAKMRTYFDLEIRLKYMYFKTRIQMYLRIFF